MRSLVCRNPWAGPCQATDCLICTTGGKGNCSRPGCTYAIKCVTCEVRGPHTVPQEEEESGERRPGQGQVGVPCLSLYHGQSGYSGYERGKDHQDDKKRKDKSNACVRHSNLYHDHAQTPGYPHGDGTCTYYSTIPIDLRIHMMCHLSDCKEPTIA